MPQKSDIKEKIRLTRQRIGAAIEVCQSRDQKLFVAIREGKTPTNPLTLPELEAWLQEQQPEASAG